MWKRTGWELNPRPVNRKSNAIPLSHHATRPREYVSSHAVCKILSLTSENLKVSRDPEHAHFALSYSIKLQVPSFIRSKDKTGAPKSNKKLSYLSGTARRAMSVEITWPWPRPFKGWCIIIWLGLATVNLSIKFEVPIGTAYKSIKAKHNVENGVVWGRAVMGHSVSKNNCIRQIAYMFLSAFCLHRFWDTVRHWSPIQPTASVFGTAGGTIPFESEHDLLR